MTSTLDVSFDYAAGAARQVRTLFSHRRATAHRYAQFAPFLGGVLIAVALVAFVWLVMP